MDMGFSEAASGVGRWEAFCAELGAIAAQIAENAAACDADGGFPSQALQLLRGCGALTAPLPVALGGLGLGTEPAGGRRAMAVLRRIGHASLPVGRLYEGHVNAVRLVCRLATAPVLRRAAADVAAGHLFGVWNTDPADTPLIRTGEGLRGAKILASGAGQVTRALVTAAGDPRPLLLVRLPRDARANLGGWTAQGMRASATGRVDFDGIATEAIDAIGTPGAYLAQPDFSAGAWRVLAVQLGGIDAILDCLRSGLLARDRARNPHQLARVGAALVAQEAASRFVERAANLAEAAEPAAEQVVAYVGLARSAVETACLDVMRLAQRSLGLAAFMRPAPIERICRDLATYLRQPAPDETLTEAAAWFMDHPLP